MITHHDNDMVPSDRKRRFTKAALIILLVAVVTVLLGYALFSSSKIACIIWLSAKASSLIGQEVRISDFSFSLPGTVIIRGIVIKNPQGMEPGDLLKVGEIIARIRVGDLLRWKFSAWGIEIHAPELILIRDKGGRLNISSGLQQFLSRKGTTSYVVDKLTMHNGSFTFNREPKYTITWVDATLHPLSSKKGTKTVVTGSMCYEQKTLTIHGLALLKDDPKQFDISLAAEDFPAALFNRLAGSGDIFSEETRLSIAIHAAGDTASGLTAESHIEMHNGWVPHLRNSLPEMRLEGAFRYDRPADMLTIASLSLHAGELSIISATGSLSNLRGAPSYHVEAEVEHFNLAKLPLLRGATITGILTSDRLTISGSPDRKLPSISGRLTLSSGSFTSRDHVIEGVNGSLDLTLAEKSTFRNSLNGRVKRIQGLDFMRPSDMKMTFKGNGTPDLLTVKVDLITSPASVRIKNGTVSHRGLRLSLEGTRDDKSISGTTSFQTETIEMNGLSAGDVTGALSFRFSDDRVVMGRIKFDSTLIRAVAERMTISTEKSGYIVSGKGIDLSYLPRQAGARQLDLHISPGRKGEEPLGRFSFSSGAVFFRDISALDVSGKGTFTDKEFSIAVPSGELFGGHFELSARGKREGIFPVSVDLSAREADLSEVSKAIRKFVSFPYSIAGEVQHATFSGTLAGAESITGTAVFSVKDLSLRKTGSDRSIVKDAAVAATAHLDGATLDFGADMKSGGLSLSLTGMADRFLSKNPGVQIRVNLPETDLKEIRNALWDIFPDKLLYAGLDGGIAAEIGIDMGTKTVKANGGITMHNLMLEGEYGEYSIGPVNGTVPLVYEKGAPTSMVDLSAFHRESFEHTWEYYEAWRPDETFRHVTVGSLRYGFRLLEGIDIWVHQEGTVLKIGKFSATIFRGRLNGSAVIDLSEGFSYHAGALLKGLSLIMLCDEIEPIRGYVKGRVDGVASARGSGTKLAGLVGRADFWSYSAGGEKTEISREFLQKVGGPSVRAFLRDRPFDKGNMSISLKDGAVIFRELEISNRNFLGVTDLSLKVAPFSNRIRLDHLLWTIVEAAERAKKK